jgi:fluoride exporter
MVLLLVFLGGGLGSVCRFVLGGAIQSRSSATVPVGTLVVNVLGCLAIGVLARLFHQEGTAGYERAALIVGFCGGFTTFSAFSFETLTLVQAGRWGAAAGYIASSIVVCVVMTAAGYAVAGGVQR